MRAVRVGRKGLEPECSCFCLKPSVESKRSLGECRSGLLLLSEGVGLREEGGKSFF